MSFDIGEIRLSKICSDEKLGTFWALGTHNQWLEIRITKSGRIKPFTIHKGKHPKFTIDERAKGAEGE